MTTPEVAFERFTDRKTRTGYRIQWFDEQVRKGISNEMRGRMDVLSQLLRDKIVANISLPVERDSNGNVIVRSIPGEFPRAEEVRLMRDIFWQRSDKGDKILRQLGTALNYGLFLEVLMDRSFLRRTLEEEFSFVKSIMTRPVKQS